MTLYQEHRAKMVEIAYNGLKNTDRPIFEQCVMLGVVIKDMMDREVDTHKIAAKAEELAVLLAIECLNR